MRRSVETAGWEMPLRAGQRATTGVTSQSQEGLFLYLGHPAAGFFRATGTIKYWDPLGRDLGEEALISALRIVMDLAGGAR